MTSQLTSLLCHGWTSLWKNRIIWLFSALALMEPFNRVIFPISNKASLSWSLLGLAISFASFYFVFLSTAGVSFVAYCVAIDKPVDLWAAFQTATDLFWKVVGISFLVVLMIVPCFFLGLIISYKGSFQIASFAHTLFFLYIPLSVFSAMGYFPVTEIIASKSTIRRSLRTSWSVFTHHFISLAIIGLVLTIALYLTTLVTSIVTILLQNSFDFAVLSKFDFISPQLSITNNSVYKLIIAVEQTVWRTYNISIYTLAYLKYISVQASKKIV